VMIEGLYCLSIWVCKTISTHHLWNLIPGSRLSVSCRFKIWRLYASCCTTDHGSAIFIQLAM